jgi:ADP-L-glycero-D-manno-heptose 6-epimerase
MKNVIVTGDAGFIGSALKKQLCQLGYNTIGWEKNKYSNSDFASEFVSLLKDCVGVFHVGADSNTLNTNIDEVMYLNHYTTDILSYCAYILDIPFIYSSSFAVYGTNGLPINLYGWSKKTAEDVVSANGQISLRYANVYGPGEERKGGMASVAYQMSQKYNKGEEIFLFPGRPTRDFVYIDDIVSANIHAFENYDYISEISNVYEVGFGESRPFEDVLDILGIPFKYSNSNPLKNYQWFTCSSSKKWLPEWEPKYNLESGLSVYKKYLS